MYYHKVIGWMSSRLEDPFVVKTLGIAIVAIFFVFLVPALFGWVVFIVSINFTVTDSSFVKFLVGLMSTGHNIPNSLLTSLFSALPALFIAVAVLKTNPNLLSPAGRWLLVVILIGLLLSVALMVMLDPSNQNQEQIFAPSVTPTGNGPGVERVKDLLHILQSASTVYLTYLFLLLGMKIDKEPAKEQK